LLRAQSRDFGPGHMICGKTHIDVIEDEKDLFKKGQRFVEMRLGFIISLNFLIETMQ